MIKNIPSPKGLPILGILPEISKNPLNYLLTKSQELGDVIKLQLAHREIFFLNHPDYAKHILFDHCENFDKGTRGWEKLRIIFNQGVFTSDGPTWLRQRRTMQPSFSHDRILKFGDLIVQEVLRVAESWEKFAVEKKTFNIHKEMMALAFRIIARAMFSENLENERIQAVWYNLPFVLHYISVSYKRVLDLPLWIPSPLNQNVKKALKNLDQIVFEMIAQRRKEKEKKTDLLSRLIDAQDPETGKKMDDQEIRDHVMTIMFAGHETTANALTFAWYLLAKHPEIDAKLHHEIDQVLSNDTLTPSHLQKLPYTTNVFQEALRLFPPAWIIPRRTRVEANLGNFRIPANKTLFLCTYTLHRHPNFWENPEKFDPDRFKNSAQNSPFPFVYLPFGVGPRICMGRELAMLEGPLVLSGLAQKYRIKLDGKFKMELDLSVTLRSKNPVLVSLEKRPFN